VPAFDVAVVGLGALGSAALQALARREVRAVGFDRLHPPHTFGSTHGRSRVIREAYYESPAYVPLVQRAYREWHRIARDSRRILFRQTGGIMIGRPDGELVTGTRRSAVSHRLAHEMLAAGAIRRRLPIFDVPDGVVGILEPRAGFLDPEGCVTSCLELAAQAGATLQFDTEVERWEPLGDGIRLATSAGSFDCGHVILAAGPWLPGLLQGLRLPLTVERQVMYWFTPRAGAERFQSDHCPVFIWEFEPGRFFYGIPDDGDGFKVARHHEGTAVTPETVDRTVAAAELGEMRALLARCIPDADGELRETAVCLYTNTPDHHFVLGPHPAEPRVFLASPCSGHGFKFASALGEAVAELIVVGKTDVDLGLFAPGRF
jgi:sarcosine oxidase